IRLIEDRQESVLETLEIVDMRVPTAAGDRHEMDARLDQPAGEQARLAKSGSAVRLAQPIRLLIDVKSPPGRGRGDEPVCFFIKGVARLHRPGTFLDRLLEM